MYCNHYGFSEKPFDVTPDPRFLYLTPDHQETLASLIYGIRERRGFITIIGEVGTGKTTLLNAVLDQMDDKIRVAFIFNTDVTFNEMFSMALYEWGLVKPKERVSKVTAIHRLNQFAIEQLAKGGNVVLIVDEAQNLSRSVMENLRLLSNLETRKHKLVQIVLSGQPELDTKLSRYELRQFAQRISLRRYVRPLNEKDTYAYLKHRLTVAKHSGVSMFTAKAQQLIWDYSGGVPRKINILCDNAFLIGYGLKKKKIQMSVVQEAAQDLKWSRLSDTKKSVNIPLSETAVPWVETKPTRRPIAKMAFMIIAGIFIISGSFFLGGSGFQFGKPTHFIANIKGTALDITQPNQAKQQKQLAQSDAPDQAVAVRKIVIKKMPEETIELKNQAEDEVKPSLYMSDFQADDNKILDPAVPVKEGKKMQKVKVKKGDTLYKIVTLTCGAYDQTTLNEVLRENPRVVDPDRILAGQVIKIPANKE